MIIEETGKPIRREKRDGQIDRPFCFQFPFRSITPAGSEASVMILLGEAPGLSSRIQRFDEALSVQRCIHRSKTMAPPLRTNAGLAPVVTSTIVPVLRSTT